MNGFQFSENPPSSDYWQKTTNRPKTAKVINSADKEIQCSPAHHSERNKTKNLQFNILRTKLFDASEHSKYNSCIHDCRNVFTKMKTERREKGFNTCSNRHLHRKWGKKLYFGLHELSTLKVH